MITKDPEIFLTSYEPVEAVVIRSHETEYGKINQVCIYFQEWFTKNLPNKKIQVNEHNENDFYSGLISPKTTNSFIKYLKKKGYDTYGLIDQNPNIFDHEDCVTIDEYTGELLNTPPYELGACNRYMNELSKKSELDSKDFYSLYMIFDSEGWLTRMDTMIDMEESKKLYDQHYKRFKRMKVIYDLENV